jgi:hypothetical protein
MTQMIWIAKVRIQEPLKVLDLTIQVMGNIEQLPLVLNSLVYSGALSEYGEDESLPQYRVPQFVADVLRRQRVDGILYTRRRDSGFPNPEACGTNLIVLRPDNLLLEIEAPVRYKWTDIPFDFPAGIGGVVLKPNDSLTDKARLPRFERPRRTRPITQVDLGPIAKR